MSYFIISKTTFPLLKVGGGGGGGGAGGGGGRGLF